MTSIRYLFRRILRSPGFFALVIATIALAIGVNLGVFSLTQAILLRSLGVPHADRLVYYTLGKGGGAFSSPAYEALRADAAMKDVFAWNPNALVRLQTNDGVVKIPGALVTGNIFSVLGIKPSLGRFFGEAEDAPGGGKDGWVAVLGYSYWKTHFGGDSRVIGQNMTVDGAPVHIVGVLPPEFTGLFPPLRADIILPRYFETITNPSQDRFANPGYFEWAVFGRLPQGVSIQSVQANLKTIEPLLRQQADPKGTIFPEMFPDTAPGSLLTVEDGRFGSTYLRKQLVTPLLAMEGLAGAILLFCCCNLILLFVGRASRESHATAIRMALGARLGNEARFAALESVALAAIGCCFAVPLAYGITRILSLVARSAAKFDILAPFSPSTSLLLAAAGITLAIACVTGACASIWHGKKHPGSILGTWSGPVAARRSSSWIIGFEVFGSILLITIAVVVGLGFHRMVSQPSGFGVHNTVTAIIDPDMGRRNGEMSRIVGRIESSPGVQSVAVTSLPPLSGFSTSDEVVSTRGEDGALRRQHIESIGVSAQYFSAIGTKVVRGRDFINDDHAGDKVCVISRRVAAALFLRLEPLGKSIYQGDTGANDQTVKPYCRVIGIAEDAHITSMSKPADAAVYVLIKNEMPFIVVRAATSELAAKAVHNAVQAVDPVALWGLETIEQSMNDSLSLWKVITISGGLCASMAAVILGIGFFGILSLQVAERKRQIGIEIALGASRTAVCLSVVKRFRLSVVLGLVLGSGLALWAAAELAKLYGLSIGFVIGGYLGSLALLGLLLLAAASTPLSRALAVSPMECLSSE